MKFIKVIINGKEYYERIDDTAEVKTDETASETERETEPEAEPEIVDARIEDGEEPTGAEKFKRDTQEFFEKVGNGAKDIGIKIVDGAKTLGAKIKEGTERLFNKDKSFDPESTEAKLLRLLPYMSKEDAHGVCIKLLEKMDTLENVNVATIMPFLSAEDCDAIFTRCIEINNKKCDFATAIPYVTPECLTRIVDDYIAGKYPSLVIDDLYPFLSDADIKRIFYHIIGESDKKSTDEA